MHVLLTGLAETEHLAVKPSATSRCRSFSVVGVKTFEPIYAHHIGWGGG